MCLPIRLYRDASTDRDRRLRKQGQASQHKIYLQEEDREANISVSADNKALYAVQPKEMPTKPSSTPPGLDTVPSAYKEDFMARIGPQ
jgi:hypothetical protein